MSHGITEVDKGVVGYCDQYGHTWHGLPQYEQLEGGVSIEKVHECLDYEVVKSPIYCDINGEMVRAPGKYMLVTDDAVISQVLVTDGYEVVQNHEMIELLRKSLLENHDVSVESCGSLFGKQRSFMNIILDVTQIGKDESPLVTRMMYSNAFGGQTLDVCVHQVRIVCANTLRAASAQGAADGTLKKFRHTKNVKDEIDNYVIELADVYAKIREHNDKLETLSNINLNGSKVVNILDDYFDIDRDKDNQNKPGRGHTRKTNNRDQIINIWDNCDNLQGGIRHTGYSLLQAYTDWTDHYSSRRGTTDEGAIMWDNIWGNKDRQKQNFLQHLTNELVG